MSDMRTYSLTVLPNFLTVHRKKTTVALSFISVPFKVDTQEGVMEIGPDTVDGWEDGYYVAYPDDGSKPYSIAPKFVRENYVPVDASG